MHNATIRTILASVAIAATFLIGAPAQSQSQKGQQRQIYACADIHKRCVSRSTGTGVSMCDGYYSDAQKTGVWPAFGQSPAVQCRR